MLMALQRPLSDRMAATILARTPAYDHIVAAVTTNGKNFKPRVAALLDVMLLISTEN